MGELLFLWGGYSYMMGDEPEVFASVRKACEVWAERCRTRSIHPIDGIFYPAWGDCQDDDYVIMDEDGCCGLTKQEVLAIADGEELPAGW